MARILPRVGGVESTPFSQRAWLFEPFFPPYMAQVYQPLGRSSLPLPGDVKLGGEAFWPLGGQQALALNNLTPDQVGICSATLSLCNGLFPFDP